MWIKLLNNPVYGFLGWDRVYTDDYSMIMVDFIDLLCSKSEESFFFGLFVTFHFVWPFVCSQVGALIRYEQRIVSNFYLQLLHS